MHLQLSLAAGAPAQAIDPKVDSCGPPGEQSWLCSTVYDITDSTRAAEIADALATPLRIVIILLVAFVLVRLTRRFIGRLVRRLERGDDADRRDHARRRAGISVLDSGEMPTARRIQRARTIGSVLRSIASVTIWSIALLTALSELGISLAPLIAGAGVIGVALGFGAQRIVRDFLSGLFMLFEDQYGVGDVIDVGPCVGTVEAVSLRTTRLRDVEGVVWHVPNGEILRVGNQSQQWSRAVLDLPVALTTDVDEASAVIQRVANEMWEDDVYRSVILAAPEVWGVEQLEADRMVIRLVVKTRPREQWNVARELRGRIKLAFEAAGISMPGADGSA
jgi:moderate conductance mechanosensitive channel